MPFREKSAWISFVCTLAVFGLYYGSILTGRVSSAGIDTLHYLLISTIGLIVLQVVLHVIAALMSRGDVGTAKDERERLIELKAANIAYHVLMIIAVVGLFVFLHAPHLHHLGVVEAPQTGLLVFACIIVADLVKSAAKIVYYRRGA